MRAVACCVAAALTLLCAAQAQAQTADEIVEKHLKPIDESMFSKPVAK